MKGAKEAEARGEYLFVEEGFHVTDKKLGQDGSLGTPVTFGKFSGQLGGLAYKASRLHYALVPEDGRPVMVDARGKKGRGARLEIIFSEGTGPLSRAQVLAGLQEAKTDAADGAWKLAARMGDSAADHKDEKATDEPAAAGETTDTDEEPASVTPYRQRPCRIRRAVERFDPSASKKAKPSPEDRRKRKLEQPKRKRKKILVVESENEEPARKSRPLPQPLFTSPTQSPSPSPSPAPSSSPSPAPSPSPSPAPSHCPASPAPHDGGVVATLVQEVRALRSALQPPPSQPGPGLLELNSMVSLLERL